MPAYGETAYQQWLDPDHLLIQLWESHSIRPNVMYCQYQEGTGRGRVSGFSPDGERDSRPGRMGMIDGQLKECRVGMCLCFGPLLGPRAGRIWLRKLRYEALLSGLYATRPSSHRGPFRPVSGMGQGG